MPELEELRRHVRDLAQAARIAEARHPSCGAHAYIRHVLNHLPADLRPPDLNLPAHPEDDNEDGRAELNRLRRELRAALASLRAAGRPAQLNIFREAATHQLGLLPGPATTAGSSHA